jgi:hypothetical protein
MDYAALRPSLQHKAGTVVFIRDFYWLVFYYCGFDIN